MRQDFTEIDDAHSLVTIPPGRYPCEVADTRVSVGRDGNPRWGLHWKVLGGPLAGKTAAWDNLHWSDRGLPRVKHVLGSMGFAVDGVVEVEPHDLLGRKAIVQVELEAYEDPVSGRRIERLAVPYRGYLPWEEGADGAEGFLNAERNGRDEPMPF